ncbi:MAG: MarR family winged helix-turn-helix transcriptional regulator [Dehalococcoidia bacterium]
MNDGTLSEFLVLEDGLLTDKQAHELASWYSTKGYVKESIAFEVNWMAIRVGNQVLEAGRPRNPVMSFARFNVLRDLYMAPDQRLSMSHLSQLLSVTLTNITKLIDGLVSSGLVERVEDTNDKRKTWAQLTPAGLAFVEELLPEVAAQVERNWSSLSTQEKKLLVHLLAKVRLHLQIANAGERLQTIEELF